MLAPAVPTPAVSAEGEPPGAVVLAIRTVLLILLAYGAYHLLFSGESGGCKGGGVGIRSSSAGKPVSVVNLRSPLTVNGVKTVRGYSGWGDGGPRLNQSITGGKLQVKEKTYERGIGTHAPSEIVFGLDGKVVRFKALAGVDKAGGNAASVVFRVEGDGKELFKSKVLTMNSDPVTIDVDTSGVKELTLVVDPYENFSWDHADWLNLEFVRAPAAEGSAKE